MIECNRCKKEYYEEDITDMHHLGVTDFYDMKIYGIMLCSECAKAFWRFMKERGA